MEIPIYRRLVHYEDVNDAERLPQDQTFQLTSFEKIWERGAALTSRLQSFEADLLTQEENLAGLATINWELIDPQSKLASPRRPLRCGNSETAAARKILLRHKWQ